MPRMDSVLPRGSRSIPLAVSVLALLGFTFFALPMAGLLSRAPWQGMRAALFSSVTVEAVSLSVAVSTVSLAIAVTIGLPLAWILARARMTGKRILRALITVPMVLPPVVAGIGLLSAFGRRGLFGGSLEAAGIHLPFTTAGAIVAATFVSAPFLILSLEAGFRSLDEELEDAARSLGASEWRVFRTITVPGLRPSLLAGGALAFARALGEFGATITFAGNLRGRTQTAPLAVFEIFQTDPGAATMLSLLMLAFSFVLIFLLQAHLEER